MNHKKKTGLSSSSGNGQALVELSELFNRLDQCLHESIKVFVHSDYAWIEKKTKSNLRKLVIHYYAVLQKLATDSEFTAVSIAQPELFENILAMLRGIQTLRSEVIRHKCRCRFQCIYQQLMHQRVGLAFIRWQNGWITPRGIMALSQPAFSKTALDVYVLANGVARKELWVQQLHKVKIAQLEWDYLQTVRDCIPEMQIPVYQRLLRNTLHNLNEMEYACVWKSVNHFQRNALLLNQTISDFITAQDEE